MGGAWIGTYEVRRCLGAGATAQVFECHQAALGRLVAVKVMHAHLASDETANARFLREGRAISRIRHPSVVQMFDVGECDGQPYLVMELVDGEDLAKHLRVAAPLAVPQAAELMLGVIAGVGAAHDAGIVHRDLKPSNIRLSRDHLGELRAKVLDFGISKVLAAGGDADLTETNSALGTAGYMSPEQLRNAKNADARSDVYSLGVVLYECLTGSLPFCGSSPYEVMHAILNAPVAPPSALRPELPAELDAVVLRAMCRDPAERFGSARDLGLALAPFARDPAAWRYQLEVARAEVTSEPCAEVALEPGEPSHTLVSSSGSSARGRGRRRLAVASAVGLTLGAALFSFILTGGPHAAALSKAVASPESRAGPSVATEQWPMAPPIETAAPSAQDIAVPRARPQGSPLPTAPQHPAPAAPRAPRQPELGTNRAPILD